MHGDCERCHGDGRVWSLNTYLGALAVLWIQVGGDPPLVRCLGTNSPRSRCFRRAETSDAELRAPIAESGDDINVLDSSLYNGACRLETAVNEHITAWAGIKYVVEIPFGFLWTPLSASWGVKVSLQAASDKHMINQFSFPASRPRLGS